MRRQLFCVLSPLLIGNAVPHNYSEGQVWSYHTRPQDTGSLLKIQVVEGSGETTVYHLSIRGVRFRRSDVAGLLAHVPVSRATLDASTDRLVADPGTFPSRATVERGIAAWRLARGGVFVISVARIVDAAERTLATPPVPARDAATPPIMPPR